MPARMRSGPPPDPDALRRDRPDDTGSWTHLPAAGRVGVSPAWPLTRRSRREKRIWDELWRRPQAVMWERHDQVVEVAIHVRTQVQAERPGATSAILGEYRRQLDALGLSEAGRLRNRWIIDGASAKVPNEAYQPKDRRPVSKDRFVSVLEGGAASG